METEREEARVSRNQAQEKVLKLEQVYTYVHYGTVQCSIVV